MGKPLKIGFVTLALVGCLWLGIGLRRMFAPTDVRAPDYSSMRELSADLNLGNDAPALTSAPDRNRAILFYRRGQQLFNQQQYNDAIGQFTEAIRLYSRYEGAYADRAFARACLRDLTGAIADFDSVIKLNPNNDKAYVVRGHFRAANGDAKGALADYNCALGINPSSDRAYCGRGASRLILGDSKGATDDYATALKVNPQSTEASAGLSQCVGYGRR